MFYLEFDEVSVSTHDAISGDATMNSKQLAGMMASDERIAALVAMAIPWYAHLTESVSGIASVKHMEIVQDDPHNYLIQAAELV
jgi:hypothetical protein